MKSCPKADLQTAVVHVQVSFLPWCHMSVVSGASPFLADCCWSLRANDAQSTDESYTEQGVGNLVAGQMARRFR